MRNERRTRRSDGVMWAFGTVLAVAGVLSVPAFMTTASGRAQAQGAIASGAGSAAAVVSIGDATAQPGDNAAVTISATSDEPMASVQIDVLYNGDEASIGDPPSDFCALADRLSAQSLSATFPATQPDPPMRRLRLGVFPPLVNPNPTFDSGDIIVCNFAVGAEVALGTEIPLAADRTQIVRDDVVICGLGGDFACEEDDGLITVGEQATPTPTETPTMDTPTPTDTPIVVATCTTDADCPDGQRCQLDGETGTCVPDDCETDMDCDLNETCDDGTCRDRPCGEGCPLGTVCDTETDTCQLIPCTDNEMCPENTTCENGFCTPECRFDSDCPGGFCVDSLCVECRDSEDCDANEFCDDNNTCQPQTGDSLVVTGGMGMAGGTASLMVAFEGDGASEVANTLSIADSGLAIAACTAAGEIPSSFEITNNGGSSVAAAIGGEGSSISEGTLYACDVSIAEGTEPGSKPVTCSGATADGAAIPCNVDDAAIVVEGGEDTPTPTATPTNTFTPTLTFTPTDTPTNTPLPRGGDEDDGCAVVAPQSGSNSVLFLLLAPALLIWRRRREW